MDAKPYDGLTGRFLAALAMSMPKLEGKIMQGWVQHPRQLAAALTSALTSDQNRRPYRFSGTDSLTKEELSPSRTLHQLLADIDTHWIGSGLRKLLDVGTSGYWDGPGNGKDGKFDIYNGTDRAFHVDGIFDILPHLEGDIVFNDLSLFAKLVRRQASGGKGLLAVNGDLNIAYCRLRVAGTDNSYWTIHARWSDEKDAKGWEMDLWSVGETLSLQRREETGVRQLVHAKIMRVITPSHS